jgi:hypothetical protein
MRTAVFSTYLIATQSFLIQRQPFKGEFVLRDKDVTSFRQKAAFQASANPSKDFSIDEFESDSPSPNAAGSSAADFTPDDDVVREEDSVSSSSFSRDDYEENGTPLRRNVIRRKNSIEAASWMERNSEFSAAASTDLKSERRDGQRAPRIGRDSNGPREPRTFREDFRGTRVFVQGLPTSVTWKELKDHFRIAGEVVFASVSADRVTRESKGHGIVQYETTDMAENAIKIMRNHPLDGYQLYVREDVQENPGVDPGMPRGPTPPTMWKCANEDNAAYLAGDEIAAVKALIKARDDARRRKKYDASDQMREELKEKYGVRIDDRLKMWWSVSDGNQVPQAIQDAKGEGRWGQKSWRQIRTSPENDACVDPELVNGLLKQRDIARKEKDFSTADALLDEARNSPDGDLYLRIHDESRTWRIWTDSPPPRRVSHTKDAAEQCMEIVSEYAPEKVDEIKQVLDKFPGREYNVLKMLKQRYVK